MRISSVDVVNLPAA